MAEAAQVATVAPLDWRTLFNASDDAPAELLAALDAYFPAFAQPPLDDGPDGKKTIGKHACLKCGGILNDALRAFAFGGGFTWGIQHGEGHCAACQWPARAYHVVRDAEGGELLTLNLILQYHPEHVRKSSEEADRG